MSPSHDGHDSPEVSARIEIALTMVRSIVGQMMALLARHAREDDLTSLGNEGALAAGRTYDADAGVPFNRWANMKIRRTITDGLRTHTDLPRRLYSRLRAIDAASWAQEGMLLDDAASPPPGSAGAADARISDRLAAMATAYATASGFFRSDEETLDALRDDRGTPEEELAREELKAAIRAAVAERPDDERILLERYYFDGATMSEASGGLSRSWASRLHARAIGGMAKSLMRAKL